jgi:hypothetical protein
MKFSGAVGVVHEMTEALIRERSMYQIRTKTLAPNV